MRLLGQFRQDADRRRRPRTRSRSSMRSAQLVAVLSRTAELAGRGRPTGGPARHAPARRPARPDPAPPDGHARGAAGRGAAQPAAATSTGSAPRAPGGARRFAVTAAALGTGEPDDRVRSATCSPPAQFFDLTDDERLAAPSFEEMDAGVAFGDDGYTFATRLRVDARRSTTPTSRSAPDGTAAVEPEPQPSSTGRWCWSWPASGPPRWRRSATAGRGPVPRPARRADAPALRAPGWAVAEAGSRPPSPAPALTWAEANELLHATTGSRPSVVTGADASADAGEVVMPSDTSTPT